MVSYYIYTRKYKKNKTFFFFYIGKYSFGYTSGEASLRFTLFFFLRKTLTEF